MDLEICKNKLDLIPLNYNDSIKNISVNSFSHNEWNIINVSVIQHIEYLCCPGDYYPKSNLYNKFKTESAKVYGCDYNDYLITISDFFVTLLVLIIIREHLF